MVTKLALHGGAPVRSKPYPAWPAFTEREEELLRQVLASGHWGGNNKFVGEFEQTFAHLHDCEYGVAAANGTVALELALQAAGIGQGDEVILPAQSFIATASAVSRVGATPVFVDIERDTYNLDVARVEATATSKTKAVIAVHFAGLMADMERLMSLAARQPLVIIEDAAQAHGAEWNGKRAGSFGRAGIFSFQNSKAMTSGEGGIVVSNDPEFAARVRSLANCGRREGRGWFEHFTLGSNCRLGGFQAAVLLAQLERLSDQIRLRQENADHLLDAVKIPGIAFAKAPQQANVQSLYLLVGRIDEKRWGVSRDEFVEAMRAEGIPCSPFYPYPLYKNEMYKQLPHRAEPCPVAEQASRDAFWLPLSTLMGAKEDTLDIARAMEKIYSVFRAAAAKGRVQ